MLHCLKDTVFVADGCPVQKKSRTKGFRARDGVGRGVDIGDPSWHRATREERHLATNWGSSRVAPTMLAKVSWLIFWAFLTHTFALRKHKSISSALRKYSGDTILWTSRFGEAARNQ